jgi:hypothetical protein
MWVWDKDTEDYRGHQAVRPHAACCTQRMTACCACHCACHCCACCMLCIFAALYAARAPMARFDAHIPKTGGWNGAGAAAGNVVRAGKALAKAGISKSVELAAKKNQLDRLSQLQDLEAENKQLRSALMERNSRIRDLRARLRHLGVRVP